MTKLAQARIGVAVCGWQIAAEHAVERVAVGRFAAGCFAVGRSAVVLAVAVAVEKDYCCSLEDGKEK